MTDLLEITETPISNQQTIILNKSLRRVLSISPYPLCISLFDRAGERAMCILWNETGKWRRTSGAKMTLSIVSN